MEELVESTRKLIIRIQGAKTLEELKTIVPDIEALSTDPTSVAQVIAWQRWTDRKTELRLDALEKAVFNPETPEAKHDSAGK